MTDVTREIGMKDLPDDKFWQQITHFFRRDTPQIIIGALHRELLRRLDAGREALAAPQRKTDEHGYCLNADSSPRTDCRICYPSGAAQPADVEAVREMCVGVVCAILADEAKVRREKGYIDGNDTARWVATMENALRKLAPVQEPRSLPCPQVSCDTPDECKSGCRFHPPIKNIGGAMPQ